MATILETVGTGLGAVALTQTTLTGTLDTFTFREGTGQILILRNPTGAPISPVIDGDGGSTASIDGLGVVNTASGYAVGSIAAGAAVSIPLDSIRQYLKGVIAINTGTGLIASLLRTK